MTRYFGVMAPAAKDAKNLPDMPPVNPEEADFPSLARIPRRNKARKRHTWASLLKRTFKIDVFQCPNCKGRMRLIEVVESTILIAQTLVALGLAPRPPPIAEARVSPGFLQDVDLGFSDFGI